MIPSMNDILSDKRLSYGALIVIGLGLMLGAFYGYQWYNASRERAAYKELAESIDAYERITLHSDSDKEVMDSERAFQAGANAHQSSVLYPFFLAFEADAQLRLGKKVEAALQLDKALKAMDTRHPLYYLYAIKAALVKIDSQDETLVKQGYAELDALGSKEHPLQDMALHYAGLDAETKGDRARAVSKFKEIIAHGRKDSYWYQLADEKIKAGD